MFKSQEKIFDYALQLVCDECGVTSTDILSSRSRMACGARFILVQIISTYMPDDAIAAKLQRTRQGVNYIRNNFTDKMLLASYQQVRSKLISWISD